MDDVPILLAHLLVTCIVIQIPGSSRNDSHDSKQHVSVEETETESLLKISCEIVINQSSISEPLPIYAIHKS